MSGRFIVGDALAELKRLPADSIDLVMTSPHRPAVCPECGIAQRPPPACDHAPDCTRHTCKGAPAENQKNAHVGRVDSDPYAVTRT